MPARRHLRGLHHTSPHTLRQPHPDPVGHPNTHAKRHAQRDPDPDTLRARPRRNRRERQPLQHPNPNPVGHPNTNPDPE